MIIVDILKNFEVHSTLILTFLLIIQLYATSNETMPVAIGMDFEVFGKVQGVFFRKHTLLKAKELGLIGWCKNTNEGTVLGYIEGNETKIDEMKKWLQYTGSPKSTIEKVQFRNVKELDKFTLDDFTIKK